MDNFLAPYQTLYINSANVASGTTSDFLVTIKGTPLVTDSEKIIRVAITTATIPLTYYGVNQFNNTFSMTEYSELLDTENVVDLIETNGVTPVTFSVTIPPGSYNPLSLVIAMNMAMTAASAVSGYSLFYLCSYSNGFYSFAIANNPGYSSTLNFGAFTTANGPLGLPITGVATMPYTATRASTLQKTMTVVLPAGQYSLLSIQIALNTAMDLASENSGYNLNYNNTISADTGRITFLIASTPGFQTILDFNSATADVTLGFPESGFSTPFSSTVPYTAPNIINISGPKEIHIRSPNFITNVYESRVQNDSTILAIIPIVASQFTTLCYIPAVPKVYAILGARTEQLSFTITDENGFTLDLNNFAVYIQLGMFAEISNDYFDRIRMRDRREERRLQDLDKPAEFKEQPMKGGRPKKSKRKPVKSIDDLLMDDMAPPAYFLRYD
jgi:hypothetical protein